MRAGTQTLIQALQAIPWAEDQDNDDEILNHDVTPAETDSDEDEGSSTYLYLVMFAPFIQVSCVRKHTIFLDTCHFCTRQAWKETCPSSYELGVGNSARYRGKLAN